ncbi:hypothetical protein HAZT_HAZT011839, partial [Hyalella azteca]
MSNQKETTKVPPVSKSQSPGHEWLYNKPALKTRTQPRFDPALIVRMGLEVLMSRQYPHLILAGLVRIGLIIYGVYHDKHNAVPYTDVDYHVVTDAARYISEGKSPFARHTYRYTPFLAYLLLPNINCHPACGKVLFCILDLVAGYLINCIIRLKQPVHVAVRHSLLWLYNPLLIAISTRGSAESVMACLVLLIIYSHLQGRVVLTGFALGTAVHFKLYPIIYSLPLYLSLEQQSVHSWEWFRPTRKRLHLVMSSGISFILLTYAAYFLY